MAAGWTALLVLGVGGDMTVCVRVGALFRLLSLFLSGRLIGLGMSCTTSLFEAQISPTQHGDMDRFVTLSIDIKVLIDQLSSSINMRWFP